MNQRLFVKFVPWNERTLSNLINKTIRFSTVFDFNDFNEFRYFSTLEVNEKKGFDPIASKVIKILKKQLDDADYIKYLLELTKIQADKGYLEKVQNNINTPNKFNFLKGDEYFVDWLARTFAFSSVGIFCLSSWEVFEDDSAQLMFAHYASNNEGLALVYESDDTEKVLPVKYDAYNEIRYHYYNRGDYKGKEIINWHKGQFNENEMNNFLLKSPKWEYEKEHRLFAKPDMHPAHDFQLRLKEIFYTRKFKEKDTLAKINSSFYDEGLGINCIFMPSDDSWQFAIEGNKTVHEYLKEKYK